MNVYSEKRSLPYTAEQLFALVSDVQSYPDFLPWCIEANIINRKDDEGVFFADMVVGHKALKERFRSKVITKHPHNIHVEYITGPLKHLSNQWHFVRGKDNSCTIDLFVEFEFRSKILQRLMEVLLNEMSQQMVKAFEKRAEKLYGSHLCS